MFSLVGRLGLLCLCAFSFGGSVAHGNVRPIRVKQPAAGPRDVGSLKALFSTAKTPAGAPVIDQLKAYQTISDAEMSDLKEALRLALIQAGMPELEKLKAEDLRAGFDAYHGITVLSEGNEVDFNLLIRPNGEVSPRHYRSEKTKAAWKVFLNTQIFMAQNGLIRASWEDGRGFFYEPKMMLTLSRVVAEVMPLTITGGTYKYYVEKIGDKGTVVFRHENYNLTWMCNEDGMVMLGSEMKFDAAGSVSLNVEDAAHVSQTKVADLIAKKPVGLPPRIGALYDALAVLMSDDRYEIVGVKAKQLGSFRGISLSPIQVAGLRDIDFGTLTLTMKDGSEQELKFEAGHFNVGTDLDKARGWLYGEGEVGGQEALYDQLN